MNPMNPSNTQALYRGMDAATLDRQYNARASVASFEQEHQAYVRESERVMQAHPGRLSVVYDGGYWRGGSRLDNAFAAGGLCARGVAVAVMDYTLAPAVRIGEIVRQVRAAVAWLARQAPALGLRGERIHVGGSSAGGHLVGMLLADGWLQAAGLPADTLGAALALSGLYELEPLQHTHINEWMRFTPAEIREHSPQALIPCQSAARLIASVGGLETDEFRRQTAHYAQAWGDAGHALQTVAMPGYNHFNIALSLSQADGPLTQALLQAIDVPATP